EGEQYPGNGVVRVAGGIAPIGRAVHRRDQEEVAEPADTEQTVSKEPDGSGNGTAIIEPVGAETAEDPQEIANHLAVCIRRNHGLHDLPHTIGLIEQATPTAGAWLSSTEPGDPGGRLRGCGACHDRRRASIDAQTVI